ncbi:MAG: hypothetical protein RLZZ628_2186 [Bacteroidota bacterium]|jgi:hypothetical protein
MSSILLRNLFRFIFLMALQILVLKGVNLGGADFNYITIFVYPLFLMSLPLNTPPFLMLLIGFLTGLTLDSFYDSIGMHAATCVFMAYIRQWMLNVLEPAGGYKEGVSPTKRNFGFLFFVKYACFFMLLHTLFYFSVEAYTFVYWRQILSKTAPSFGVSFLFIMLYSFIFDPAE